jgi:DNA-binding transcriptional ArsR family regulator
LLKALANRRRLAILRYLAKEKEAKVGDIATAIKLSFKATSRHLQQLSSADIVERDQRGLEMWYHIGKNSPPPIKTILSYIPNSHE